MFIRTILFLILNFAALWLGSSYTQDGVGSDWYQNINKAPWTPAGWVFGVAWTSIMVCFSIFMAKIWTVESDKKILISMYLFQWILNFSWNPIFFFYKDVALALLVILGLTTLVAYFFIRYLWDLRAHSLWISPYLIWLFIASSLNAYILFYN